MFSMLIRCGGWVTGARWEFGGTLPALYGTFNRVMDCRHQTGHWRGQGRLAVWKALTRARQDDREIGLS